MNTQLDLLSSTEPYEPLEVPGAIQRGRVLAALRDAGSRGLSGEEAAVACGIRATHIATTRLNELRGDGLVCRSEKRERPTASGVKAFVWFVTPAGVAVVEGIAA